MEISNSRFDVLLYRRYPNDAEKEKDYGPGYIKLYSLLQGKDDNNNKTMEKATDEATETVGKNNKQLYPIQVVLRNHGTMKIRSNHIWYPATTCCSWNNNNENKQDQTDDESVKFDTSFDNELRYNVVGDRADMSMTGVPSVVYGKEVTSTPLNFPLSFEFHSDDDRDKFVNLLKQLLGKDYESTENKNNEPTKAAAKEEKEVGKSRLASGSS